MDAARCRESAIELVPEEESRGNRQQLQRRRDEQDADNGADERADDFAPVQTRSRQTVSCHAS